jgi:putative spermidine/putrescine transport system substrate-binding protein
MHYPMKFARHGLVAAAALTAAALAFGEPAFAQAPKSPQVINVVDVGGALALLQDAIEAYKTKNPTYVSRFTFTKAPAPELPGKLKAMQAANRADIDLVLGGSTFSRPASSRICGSRCCQSRGEIPRREGQLPRSRAKMQELAKDQALAVVFMPAGPLVEYNPAKVKEPPTTPAALLAWCKANPNKLVYARPANSGPGRTFLMGLPYMLGDKDPKDPVNGWEKTWAYLKDLNSCIEYYPTGTGIVMKELGEGSRDMTVTMTGWDINPRALGIVPKEYKVAPFDNMTWVNDTQFLMVPKGVSRREARGRARPDQVPARAAAAGDDLRQGLLLSGPGREERAALDGAEGEPGRDQGIRPSRV